MGINCTMLIGLYDTLWDLNVLHICFDSGNATLASVLEGLLLPNCEIRENTRERRVRIVFQSPRQARSE